MTISEAFERGIFKLCKAHWAFPDDRLELQVSEYGGQRYYAPWALLVSPSQEKFGHPVEQRIIILTDRANDWLEWTASDAPDSASTADQSSG